MLSVIKRLFREEEGMEMVEWSIVGVVFALAAALVWSSLEKNINTAVTSIGTCVSTGTCQKAGP